MKLDNCTQTSYVPPIHEKANRLKEWQTLRQIVAELRGPNGCPWDKEQTHTNFKEIRRRGASFSKQLMKKMTIIS